MRKILIGAINIGIAAIAAFCAFFAYALHRSPVFAAGEGYEVYGGASSSALVTRTENPFLHKLTAQSAGESVRYSSDCYEELKTQYGAELLFTEESCGVKNYYLYSPCFSDCVRLNGYCVNLHIAVRGEQTAVGSPLIFGGM